MSFVFLFGLPDQHGADAGHGLLGSVGIAKGGQADIPLAAGTKASAGGGDHVGLFQELIEELPGAHAVGGLEPDVGGVHAAKAGETGSGQALPDDPGVLLIISEWSP